MIERSELASGLRVVTESLPQLRSVTLGAWVGTGARDEVDEVAGASHFLEHLLFKGTETRTARDIADTIESVGGEMNAFTTHEHTVFYVRVPDTQLDLAADVLHDIVWRPAFRPDEVETERQVILEEIAMRDDTPDDLVHDVFASTLFPDHPLGREVIGFEDTVTSMTRDSVRSYHGEHYRAANTVFAAAGNLEHAAVRDLAERLGPSTNGAAAHARELPAFSAPLPVRVVERDTEQAHLVLGVRGRPRVTRPLRGHGAEPRARGRHVVATVPGDPREPRPRVLRVFVPCGLRRQRLPRDLRGHHRRPGQGDAGAHPRRDRSHRARARSPTTSCAAAKGNLTGSLLMSLETSSARMRRLGHGELVEGEIPALEELARASRRSRSMTWGASSTVS